MGLICRSRLWLLPEDSLVLYTHPPLQWSRKWKNCTTTYKKLYRRGLWQFATWQKAKKSMIATYNNFSLILMILLFVRFYSTLSLPPPPRVTRPPSVKLHQKRSFNQSFSSTLALSDGSECTLKFILG